MPTLQDYRSRPHWSFSAVNQFLNICSLQFAFERVYKLRKAFTPLNLSFGSAFHRTLEWMSSLRKSGTLPMESDVRDRFRDFWARQVAEDRDIRWEKNMTAESCADQGSDLVAAYLAAVDPNEEIVSVNEPFAVPLIDRQGNALDKPLVGEIDCVVRKGDVITLVDWKTSARRWSKDQADKSLQPTAYLYAYRQLHGMEPAIRFDVIVKNKTPVVESHPTTRTLDQFHRMVELVKRVESMIAAEHFLHNEGGMYCAGCPHRTACQVWHRAEARPWVRLAA